MNYKKLAHDRTGYITHNTQASCIITFVPNEMRHGYLGVEVGVADGQRAKYFMRDVACCESRTFIIPKLSEELWAHSIMVIMSGWQSEDSSSILDGSMDNLMTMVACTIVRTIRKLSAVIYFQIGFNTPQLAVPSI